MTFKDLMREDIKNTMNIEEFAQSIIYSNSNSQILVNAQVFNEESDVNDSFITIVLLPTDAILGTPNGYFLINNIKHGIISFSIDEEQLLYTILTQKVL